MNTATRTLDPYSRLGTAYVLMYSGFDTSDEPTRRSLILAMDNVAASLGCPHDIREEINLPVEGLKGEFQRVIETVADVSADMHPLLTDDLEEILALYLPVDCIKHVLAHRVWENDPANWGRLLGFIIARLSKNGPACRHITEVVAQYAAAA